MIKSKPLTLVMSKTRIIIVLTQFLLYHIISTIYIEKYKPKKLENKQTILKTESARNRTICNDMNINHTSATPKILKI